MLVVISSPFNLPKESGYINKLFNAGLPCLHLRKPTHNTNAVAKLLNEIAAEHHPKIKIHAGYELCNDFNLGGVHLPEKQIEQLATNKELQQFLGNTRLEISASFHSIAAIHSCKLCLSYGFLSPVFTSISKNEYLGKGFSVTNMPFNTLALGGITPHTILKTKELGYNGAAVLGYIWQSEDILQAFNNIRNIYEQVYASVHISGQNGC
ncbi:thiamine phosphate synthase [Zhouia sp. PK063]|uniref:thiamine phosphate synthase n=1 Tax=Zhouia sp. PK063 TaxID=3373602 RepID=UPI0037B7BA92